MKRMKYMDITPMNRDTNTKRKTRSNNEKNCGVNHYCSLILKS